MDLISFKEANTKEEKKAAFALRKLIFADEQGIPAALDRDEKDNEAFHLIGLHNNEVIATGRLFCENKKGHLSRIAINTQHRGNGLGKKVVLLLIEKAKELKLDQVYLYPHSYLQNFYQSLGFTIIQSYTSEIAGHKIIKMEKNLK